MARVLLVAAVVKRLAVMSVALGGLLLASGPGAAEGQKRAPRRYGLRYLRAPSGASVAAQKRRVPTLRDCLEARFDARLGASAFFNATAFRQTEARLLKNTLHATLHPVEALKTPLRWSALKLRRARRNTARTGAQLATHYAQLVGDHGLLKGTWILGREGASKGTRKTAHLAKKLGRWVKEHPKQALMWGPGMLGVFAVVLPVGAVELGGLSLTGVAPALASSVTQLLAAHGVGASVTALNVPAVVGTGVGGALASGVSSAWAHGLSMINGKDKPNIKRVIQDAGMSAAFGFVGFGVAEGMRSGATALGLAGSGMLRRAYDWSGLMAFEMGKNYVQNGVNNLNIKIHNYHQAHPEKRFSKLLRALKINGIEDKDGSAKRWGEIVDQTFLLETATNTPRVINSAWTTNFALKSIIDMGARVVWDRILHGHAGDAKAPQSKATPASALLQTARD